MLFARLAETSAAVAATSSRIAKRAAIAAAVREVAAPRRRRPRTGGRPSSTLVVTYLSGTLRQRRTGVGWASLGDLPAPARRRRSRSSTSTRPSSGSRRWPARDRRLARADAVAEPVRAGDRGRAALLRGVVIGNVRRAPWTRWCRRRRRRRPACPRPSYDAPRCSPGGSRRSWCCADRGEEALAEFGCEVGRPVLPMLASSAPTSRRRWRRRRRPAPGGGRHEARRHPDPGPSRTATRSRSPPAASTTSPSRLPEVVAAVRALPAHRVVLDGEALALDDDGRARAVPGDRRRSAPTLQPGRVVHAVLLRRAPRSTAATCSTRPAQRLGRPRRRPSPERQRVPRRSPPTRPRRRGGVRRAALAHGHEGVVVKALDVAVRRRPARLRRGSR